MNRVLRLAVGVVVVLCLSIPDVSVVDAFSVPKNTLTAEDVVGNVPMPPELRAYIDDSPLNDKEPEFIQAAEGVYVAKNYGFANVIILEGPDGLVVVDSTESSIAAEQVRLRLRTVTAKPIKAIVFTHNHQDHVFGAEAFLEDPANPPDVWAYQTLPLSLKFNILPGPKYTKGAIHQFGLALGKNMGWPSSRFATFRQKPVLPNKFITQETQTVSIAGINITFIHVFGDTTDSIALWLPDRGILLPADAVYKAFPNVYPIRGDATRDVLDWANSVRKLRDLNSGLFLPQHGDPINGQQTIYDVLTAYISAMVYVHDQTVRHMNKFVHPEEIAALVQLPESLLKNPYVRQQYGRVDWASRNVYARYIGWYSGDPVDLKPLSPSQRASRLVSFVGENRLISEAERALTDADYQWGLELISHVLRAEPTNERAQYLKMEILRAIAAQQINPLARNSYLTAALDDYHFIDWQKYVPDTIAVLPTASVFDVLKTRVKAELTDGLNVTLYLQFNDTRSTYKIQIVYSVLNVDRLPAPVIDPELQVVVCSTEQTWKLLVAGKSTADAAFANGSLAVSRDFELFKLFLSYFDR